MKENSSELLDMQNVSPFVARAADCVSNTHMNSRRVILVKESQLTLWIVFNEKALVDVTSAPSTLGCAMGC